MGKVILSQLRMPVARAQSKALRFPVAELRSAQSGKILP